MRLNLYCMHRHFRNVPAYPAKRRLQLHGDLTRASIGLYRENAIAIEIEAKYPFGGIV